MGRTIYKWEYERSYSEFNKKRSKLPKKVWCLLIGIILVLAALKRYL